MSTNGGREQRASEPRIVRWKMFNEPRRAIAVWLAQLAFPTLALVPIVARFTGTYAPGVYTWTLLGLVVVWYAGCLAALGVRPARRWIATHLYHLIHLYISTSVGLVVIESYYRHQAQALWLGGHRVTPTLEYSRELGWKLVQGRDGVGEHGWRGPYLARSKAKGTFRIVCLGDSATHGFQCRWDEAWPHQLELMLNADSGWTSAHGRTEVVNLGVTAFGTDQELLALKREGFSYQPDVVILHACVNDFYDVCVDHKWPMQAVPYPKPFFALESGQLVLKRDYAPPPTQPSGRVYNAGDPLDFGLHLFVLRHLERWLEKRDIRRNPDDERWPILEAYQADYARSRPLFWALVREMAKTASAAGSRFLVTLSPVTLNAPTDVPPYRVGSFLREYQADAAAAGVPAINCVAEFFAEGGNDRFLAVHDPHLNAQGNTLIARHTMQWLKANIPAAN
jgi:lysophospholipase L1-like esterase